MGGHLFTPNLSRLAPPQQRLWQLAAIQARASGKDYFDLEAIIQAGIDLPQALAAARAVYGPRFDVTLSLRALRYYGDGDLNELPAGIQRRLTDLAGSVDLSKLPELEGKPGLRPGGFEP